MRGPGPKWRQKHVLSTGRLMVAAGFQQSRPRKRGTARDSDWHNLSEVIDEGQDEQTRDSQGGHSGVDGASTRQATDRGADPGFAVKAVQRHELPRSRNDAYQVMMGWLLPRTGKP